MDTYDDHNAEVKAIDSLFLELVEGEIDPESFAQLQSLLKKSEENCLHFSRLMSVHVAMREWAHSRDMANLPQVTGPHGERSKDAKVTLASAKRGAKHPFLAASVSRGWAYSLVAAVALLLWASLTGWWEPARPEANSTLTASRWSSPSTSQQHPSTPFVGIVRRVADGTQWGEEGAVSDFLLRIEPGERLVLEEGLAEIELESGAKVTMHGGSSYTFISSNQGRLNSGTISAISSDAGYSVQFGSSSLQSVGNDTRFAVAVNESTMVAVYKGEVNVGDAKLNSKRPPVLLAEGNMVFVDRKGVMAADGNRSKIIDAATIARKQSKRPPQHLLSITDIVSGGDGKQDNLSGAIDLATGQGTFGWRPRDNESKPAALGDSFLAADRRTLIDGAFVAWPGATKIPVSTAGHSLSGIRGIQGQPAGFIWARRRLSSGDSRQWGTGDSSQKEYSEVARHLRKAQDGAIGISANTGITFDLAKTKKTHSTSLRSFRSVVRSVTSHEEQEDTGMRLCVLVDGHVRATSAATGGEADGGSIEVLLTPEDQYLTLVAISTKANQAEQIVLFDPMLQGKHEHSKTGPSNEI